MSTIIDLNKLMNRIQSLLGLADQPGLATEAATTYRARAEALMREYRVAEENLIASDQATILPAVRRIWLGQSADPTRGTASKAQMSYFQEWYSLLDLAARHAQVKVHYQWGKNDELGQNGLFGVLVGYEGDLRLAEIVYTNARLVFGERVEPQVDSTLSDQVNCYRLRSAGITRRKVAKMVFGEDTHAAHAKVAKLYKAECDARGEQPLLDGRGINAGLFRDQYAKAFVAEFGRCLAAARDAADSAGGALVLHGREQRVNELFWETFPELAPDTIARKRAEQEAMSAAIGATKPKRREPKPYWETAAYRRDMERADSATARAGRDAGRRAAREVELDRPAPAKRLDEATHFPAEWNALEG